MKVYFVRHGESIGNKAGLHQTAETPLSPTGKKQAKIVARRLKDKKIDLIYSSTHLRALQTSEIISKVLNIKVEPWNNLIELRTASEIHNKHLNDPEIKEIKEIIKKNFVKGNWKYSDEETFNELNGRAKEVLNHLLQMHEDQNIVCVSHSSMIKAIISKMVFGDALKAEVFQDFRYHFWSTNTGISVCEYEKGRGWGIISWNDSSHL